jgi:hypothetical protein
MNINEAALTLAVFSAAAEFGTLVAAATAAAFVAGLLIGRRRADPP